MNKFKNYSNYASAFQCFQKRKENNIIITLLDSTPNTFFLRFCGFIFYQVICGYDNKFTIKNNDNKVGHFELFEFVATYLFTACVRQSAISIRCIYNSVITFPRRCDCVSILFSVCGTVVNSKFIFQFSLFTTILQ